MKDFEEGIDRVIAGPERKSRLVSDKEKKIIAYHETGHALVAKLIPSCDPVHKISIIPRGHMALGYTLQLPEEDRFLMSKSDLLDKICVLLGGRVAEELQFGDVTTGSSNDLERATQIARQMVTEFGMSDKLGLVKLGHKHHEVFLGRDIGEERNYSDEVAYTIDQEVKMIIDSCYARVRSLLEENSEEVEKVARVLLEKGSNRRKGTDGTSRHGGAAFRRTAWRWSEKPTPERRAASFRGYPRGAVIRHRTRRRGTGRIGKRKRQEKKRRRSRSQVRPPLFFP